MGRTRKNDERAAALVFSALGDPVRLSLVSRLTAKAPLSATELAKGLPLSRQGVEKHLHVLVDAGVAKTEKRGRERHYDLEVERVNLARQYLETIAAGWERALERLRDFVED